MPAALRDAPDMRVRRIRMRQERKMSLLDGIDRPGHGLEMIRIYGRVRRLHKYRRIMRETIDLLSEEAAIMRDMREMTNDIDTLEQETKELWEEGGVEFMWLHERGKGNTSAEDGNSREGCQLGDITHSSASQGTVRVNERPMQGWQEAPPALHQPQDEQRQTHRSRQKAGVGTEPTETEASVKANLAGARHEQDDHSAYVKLEGVNDIDVQMNDGSSETARKKRSRKRGAREAQPRPFYVPASVEDETE